MFMKCIDGNGLVKLVKMSLALLPSSAHFCGEDKLTDKFILSFDSVEKTARCHCKCFYLSFNVLQGVEGEAE